MRLRPRPPATRSAATRPRPRWCSSWPSAGATRASCSSCSRYSPRGAFPRCPGGGASRSSARGATRRSRSAARPSRGSSRPRCSGATRSASPGPRSAIPDRLHGRPRRGRAVCRWRARAGVSSTATCASSARVPAAAQRRPCWREQGSTSSCSRRASRTTTATSTATSWAPTGVSTGPAPPRPRTTAASSCSPANASAGPRPSTTRPRSRRRRGCARSGAGRSSATTSRGASRRCSRGSGSTPSTAGPRAGRS